MTLDIKGGLKNTSVSHKRYVVFEELLSNAIDSYLIRRSADPQAPPLRIEIGVEFVNGSLFPDADEQIVVWCKDNGAGFGDAQVKAFVTKDTTYKDYLLIQGIGKCKGAGRIQFFHYFSQLDIDSVFDAGGSRCRRTLRAHAETREITESDFVTQAGSGDINTCVTLKGMAKRTFAGLFDPATLRVDFSARTLHDVLNTSFMQRFIVLKKIIGNFTVAIAEVAGANRVEELITSEHLPTAVQVLPIRLSCDHRSNIEACELRLTRYSLDQASSPSLEHEVALCANSAIAISLTKRFLKSSADRRRPIDGKIELLLVEGDLLDQKVNVQRDGFDLPSECSHAREFDEEFSLQDIIESLEDTVYAILTPPGYDREALIRSTQEKFGISRAMLEKANIKIHYGDTEENIARRTLRRFQDEIVQDTSKLVDMKQELLKLDPRSSDFRNVLADLSWRYTSSLQKMDMANLSQLVVRRTAMLDVLQRATELMLDCQQDAPGKRRDHEKIIHNIFFPTGKDSNDTVDHDIWILNEEYHYYDHIASDKALSSISWDNQKLFEADIDESLERLFRINNEVHHLKRPDIAIFNKEGAAIIIEFKAPGVQLQEHINDLAQYARLLAAKSDGRIKRFYGYLVGDSMDESRMPPGWTKFPASDGYFLTARLDDPKTGRQYGELYSEMLFYQHFVTRAHNRLEVYKRRLNVRF
ncbi:hypothetical protein F2P45_09030 [Massilia sp. CCM 8733]|uniref:Type I restriction enzyme R protein N-terminal domain-containing protein n=1 Tax=Massilia mucilaginosa TaxID=2609282 RepID=A0ABX0NQY8_9BURK|nr:hypothetical protein [Massilia mucilaginosa]NHZ89158.1 hypothetical protein [Massilia mucilaginosa]